MGWNISQNGEQFNVREERKTANLLLAIPFYKAPEIVSRVFNSLVACAEEFQEKNVRVVFYNDSPDCNELNTELNKALESKPQFKLELIVNEKNLGFIGTMNKAIQLAKNIQADLVILNSDTVIYPGVISELLTVAYADPMIGFVSPRSNNATICTLPHGSEHLNLSPEKGYSDFKKICNFMPPYTFVPTCVGFCLFIKNKLINEIGLFDTVYGMGYNEENDFIMRANRLGYSAVLANKAYVWHEGEKSFATLPKARKEREAHNHQILIQRYPEYLRLIHNYFGSAEYRAESFISGLLPDKNNTLTIGFDFSSLGTFHNGTFKAGINLISAADKSWPTHYKIRVVCHLESWNYHGLQNKLSERVSRCDVNDFSQKMAAIVRLGQPFSVDNLDQTIYRAPIVAYFMLDTIAADCGYLKLNFNENIWHFVLNWSDIIFTNSSSTCSQFVRRYSINDKVLLYPTLHSASPNEYYISTNESLNHVNVPEKRKIELLIVGNHYEHKGLKQCVLELSSNYPNIKFLVLGGENYEAPNIQNIANGKISEREMAHFYNKVDAIIYPSYIEGFGFPFLHSLAYKKPIFLREMPVYREIMSKLQSGHENIYVYSSTEELVQMFSTGVPKWIGGEAIGEPFGWTRSANEIIDVLERKIKEIKIAHVAERLRWFDLIFHKQEKTRTNFIARISNKIKNKWRHYSV